MYHCQIFADILDCELLILIEFVIKSCFNKCDLNYHIIIKCLLSVL